MPRPSLRSAFVVVAVLVAGAQLVAVTLAALPPNRYSDATRSQTSYLAPYFQQNWRLFAPNPVSDDREVLFQGAYVDASGTLKRTTWVNWTTVELDLVRHRLVGNRAGYITNKMFESLSDPYNNLTDSQQAIIDDTSPTDPSTWSQLDDALLEDGAPRVPRIIYLRYEKSMARLATDVLQGRYPGLKLTAVRYDMHLQGVVPYAARHESKAAREAARPAASDRYAGWRVPTPGPARERRAVADFDRRHR